MRKLFLALVIGTIAFTSCKKEQTTSSNQLPDGRTPIAMRDASGNIVNLVKVEDFQQRFNEMSTTKGDNIVIESYHITEPTDEHPYFLTVDYIDVDEEKSYSIALIGDYVEEFMNYLYMTNDLKSGNFEFCTRKADQSKAVVKYTNGVVEVNEDPTPDMLPPSWCVRCDKQYCAAGTCKPSGGHGDYFCSDCTPAVPGGCEGCQPSCHASYYEPGGVWGFFYRIIASW